MFCHVIFYKMPQSVFIQVGQCGNQVGFRFWESVIREYGVYNNSLNEEDICHFLKLNNNIVKTHGKSLEECYNARAVLIDMEEGVISKGCRGPLRTLFNQTQILTDVSGSGNNWAVGNKIFGRKYLDAMINLFRKEAEECDNLESFLLVFSMGGGTGSGLGTAALECLHNEFSKVPRLVFAVFPSIIDDVVTSPYNSMLANNKLIEHADCVIPFENQVLNDICMKMDKNKNRILKSCTDTRPKLNSDSKFADVAVNKSGSKPFDDFNELIASTVLDFTSSSRYPGTLNVDMSDIIVNMTPFPHLHYLVSSVAPFIFTHDDFKIEQVFNDLFSESHRLFDCSVKKGVLSAAILCRGQVPLIDLQNNLNRLGQSVEFVPWNDDGWKLGLCDYAPADRLRSLLMLANTSGISHKFEIMKAKFIKMYQKKAHIHHFSEVDPDINEIFNSAIINLTKLIAEYKSIDSLHGMKGFPRPSVI